MKKLKGTKTAENLLKAFAGESQARNRYTFFSVVADTEGFKQIKKIFLETADNEKEHANRFYNLLVEGFKDELPANVTINADYPVAMGTTLQNLKAAANGEHEEWSNLYPSFAKVAKSEGFPEVANAFERITEAEKAHETRYNKLAENVEKGLVFTKKESIKWKCDNCGYVHEGTDAPEVCPSCLHSKAYFEAFTELA